MLSIGAWGGVIEGAVLSASAYPAQSMFAGFGLAAGLLISFGYRCLFCSISVKTE